MKCLVLQVVWLAICAVSATWTIANPPNLVYIMVDDMGPADAGFMGSKAIATPNLDRLASESLVFTESYSGCTVCAPCRSVLLTGKHTGHTSVRLNTGGVPLMDEDVTFAEVLKRVGYRTGGFGKWGVGDIGTSGVPERQGFDLFYGYYHQVHAHRHYPDFLIRNSVKETLEATPNTSHGYAPRLIFEEMKRFVRDAAQSGEPFMCYAPWTPPHGNYDFPKDDPAWARYEDKDWIGNERQHAAMVTLVDGYVGELVTLLDELDIRDNTILFFHSDNGASLLPQQCPNLQSSGRFRGTKRTPYEGGIRAPMLVNWPGRIQPRTNSQFVVSAQDVLPTLADLADASEHVPDDVTGLSYAAVLLGGAPTKMHEYHYWEWEAWNWGESELIPGGLMQSLRKGDWKLVRPRDDQPWELYNLSEDVGETVNLAAKYPAKLRELVALASDARVPMRPQREPQHPMGQRFN